MIQRDTKAVTESHQNILKKGFKVEKNECALYTQLFDKNKNMLINRKN